MVTRLLGLLGWGLKCAEVLGAVSRCGRSVIEKSIIMYLQENGMPCCLVRVRKPNVKTWPVENVAHRLALARKVVSQIRQIQGRYRVRPCTSVPSTPLPNSAATPLPLYSKFCDQPTPSNNRIAYKPKLPSSPARPVGVLISGIMIPAYILSLLGVSESHELLLNSSPLVRLSSLKLSTLCGGAAVP